MVNANELRLGNKVITKKGDILTVGTVQYVFNKLKNIPGYEHLGDEYVIIDFLENKVGNLITSSKDDKIDPIVITTEILLACGFQINKYDNCWETNDISIDVFKEGEYWYYTSEENRIKITSLHQLQNLYFALTGLELEIKL